MVSHGTTDLQRLARAVDEEDLERISEGMVAAIAEGFSEIDFDADLAADALAASRATGGDFLAGLAAESWIPPATPPELSDLARTVARRGMDLAALIKMTRQGQSVFWPAVMDSAERAIDDPAVRMRVLTIAFERFSVYLETLLDRAVVVFQEERDRTIRGAHARRNEAIQALLKGQDLDPDGASRALGYELLRWHTAVTLSQPSGGADALEQLESVANQISGALHATGSLSTASGAHGLWCWFASYGPPGATEVSSIAALELPPGVQTSVGPPANGVAGFLESHEGALAAQRVALANDAAAQVILYTDVEVVSLLWRDERAARALVARELTGLTGLDRQSATLRETVLAFLRCGNSATAAGRDLNVHTNTVRYRIGKAEEIFGHTLQGQHLQMQLALMLVDVLGARILPPPDERRS
jgi:hypothetical protein